MLWYIHTWRSASIYRFLRSLKKLRSLSATCRTFYVIPLVGHPKRLFADTCVTLQLYILPRRKNKYFPFTRKFESPLSIMWISEMQTSALKSNHSLVSHARLTGRELFPSNHSMIMPYNRFSFHLQLYSAFLPGPHTCYRKSRSHFDERVSERFTRSDPFLRIQFQTPSQEIHKICQ